MKEMATKAKRKIVRIDEDKCDGCGNCIISCAEGALKLIDGKAKLISDRYCDGLGACLGECPRGAIGVEEREAEEFDEEAAKEHLREEASCENTLPCGCSSATVTQFKKGHTDDIPAGENVKQESMLSHWPVQLTLVPPTAPFLQNADVMLIADCVPFAYAGLHNDLLKDHAVLVACPKLDNFEAHLQKLTHILADASIKSLTVVHMEVPCCSGLVHMVREAIKSSGKTIPLGEITIGIHGEIKI
jgi:NAD-dependent dihydropyrimidine dehydrogenase PreA subunit